MRRSPTFIRSQRRAMLRGALTITADFGRCAARPAPHRAWGERAIGKVAQHRRLLALLDLARAARDGGIPVFGLDVDAAGPSILLPDEVAA